MSKILAKRHLFKIAFTKSFVILMMPSVSGHFLNTMPPPPCFTVGMAFITFFPLITEQDCSSPSNFKRSGVSEQKLLLLRDSRTCHGDVGMFQSRTVASGTELRAPTELRLYCRVLNRCSNSVPESISRRRGNVYVGEGERVSPCDVMTDTVLTRLLKNYHWVPVLNIWYG